MRNVSCWIALGDSVMNTRSLRITLFALCFSATGTHAATSGVIRFTGGVSEPASAAITVDVHTRIQLQQTRQTYPLNKAQAMLSSDVLNYFATYAPKDAALIRVTYL